MIRYLWREQTCYKSLRIKPRSKLSAFGKTHSSTRWTPSVKFISPHLHIGFLPFAKIADQPSLAITCITRQIGTVFVFHLPQLQHKQKMMDKQKSFGNGILIWTEQSNRNVQDYNLSLWNIEIIYYDGPCLVHPTLYFETSFIIWIYKTPEFIERNSKPWFPLSFRPYYRTHRDALISSISTP